MLFHSGGDGQNVRIKDDVFGGKADFVDQNIVGSFADSNFVVGLNRLSFFIKSHHDCGRAVSPNKFRTFDEFFFAFLETNRVDDRFTLDGPQSGLDDGPFGTVDHDRNGTD